MEELIYGRQPVMEALKAGRTLNKIYLLAGARGLEEIRTYARQVKVPLQELNRERLNNLARGGNHQGVVALAAPKEYQEPQEILELARRRQEQPLVVILDHLMDPGNVGTIIRSAEAAGAHGVIIPTRRGASLTDAVARASAGAWEYVPVARVANIAGTIETLKQEGLWIVGASPEAPTIYTEIDFKIPLALVVGSEDRGLSRLVEERCDYLVKLPMRGRVESLNVASAATVMLYEILRQRGPKP